MISSMKFHGMGLIILFGIIAYSIDVTEGMSFSSVDNNNQLPDYLGFIKIDGQPKIDRAAAAQASNAWLSRLNASNSFWDRRLRAAKTKSGDSTTVPDTLAWVNTLFRDTNDCDRYTYGIDARTPLWCTFATAEEKVIVYTLIRIIANMLFASSKKVLSYAEDSSDNNIGTIDLEFDIPDALLFRSYSLMSDIERQSRNDCRGRKKK